MADKTFSLEILTPHRPVFTGAVTSLIAPGTLGSLGVLANHAPLVTTLGVGTVIYRDGEGNPTTLKSAAQGFLEVGENRAVVLLDSLSE